MRPMVHRIDRLDRWVGKHASAIQAVAGSSVLVVCSAAAVLIWLLREPAFPAVGDTGCFRDGGVLGLVGLQRRRRGRWR